MTSTTAPCAVNEWRTFGPPGCGKTTFTAQQVARAVEKFGPLSVLVTSFSKAAATELTTRSLPVPQDQIGTLHSHCFRALGWPEVAETAQFVDDWNKTYPKYAIHPVADGNLDDPNEERASKMRIDDKSTGDDILMAVNRYRNLRAPMAYWSANVTDFYDKWTEWKRANKLMDFTDMVEEALRSCEYAPGNPSVIFCDEAQDFTRLQLDLIRKWGQHVEHFVLVGDDDQTIYDFIGASPDVFLYPEVPAANKTVLSQSYRLPRAIHSFAARWIRKVRHREPKEFRPRDCDGDVERTSATWQRPRLLADEIEEWIAAGKTVMALASCGYMLGPLRSALIERGVPFHNPYRKRRAQWNPLDPPRGISAAERLLAFLKPHHEQPHCGPWNAGDLRMWLAWIEASGALVDGAKTAVEKLEKLDGDFPITMEHLHEFFLPEAYDELVDLIMNGATQDYIDWWMLHVLKSRKETARYPYLIASKHGPASLTARPYVVLGTIHSVKGGEADIVALFPDLSRAGALAWDGVYTDESTDAVRRLFYVGMTRARETLLICSPDGRDWVTL